MNARTRATSSTQKVASSVRSDDECASFKDKFPKRFSVRIHMTVLLVGVFLSGLFFNKTLFELGLRSLFERYLISLFASYAVFFLFMKMWLWYVTDSPRNEWSNPDVNMVDPGDALDLIQSVTRAGHNVDAGSGVHGGDFGGGGATDVWGPAITPKAMPSAGGSGSHVGSGGGGFDLGDDAVVLIALAALVLAIFGAGVYLVWAAPSILSEAAFQAFLAAGLIKASRNITRRGWMGSVLRATCVPFLIVLLMTGIFGWVAHKYYPHATRLAEIFRNQDRQDKSR